jgi:LL-diaminopimelate aminotransferase
MKIPQAHRLDTFPEYVFSNLNKKVKLIEKEKNRPVLNFGQGTPDIAPSTSYTKALLGYIQASDSHLYPGYGAIPEFSDALIHWYQKRFGVKITADELLPLLGAKDGIAHIPLTLFNESDEVLVPDPGYPAFSTPAVMVGAVPVFYTLSEKNKFKIDFSELTKRLTKRTKCIWVNFPSNPTGQVATLDELRELVAFATKHNLFILYDNAYSEITFDGFIAPSILEVKGAKDIAVELGSFSKSFSFAGFRMGYIAGNALVIKNLAKVKSQMDSGLSIPLQRLGAFALVHTDVQWQKKMIATYQTRRGEIATALLQLGLTFTLTQGSLYIWAKIPDKEQDAYSFCMRLLEEKQILLTPGSSFGESGKRFVRVSIGVNIERINEYF